MFGRKQVVLTLSLALLASLAVGPPAMAVTTLWNFLGIPQGVNKIRDATINRRGNFPGLERKPPLKGLADPANLESKNPAIKKAAQIKQEEDLKKQKIKALKYLAKVGCGCYPGVKEALMAALDDCTEEVRYTAAKQIGKAAENKCEHCNKNCCCDEEMTKKLAEVAYEKDDCGCWLESSQRVRDAAREAMRACCRANRDRGGEPVTAPPPSGETVPPPPSGETVPPAPGETAPTDPPPSPPTDDAAQLFEVKPGLVRETAPKTDEPIRFGETELVFERATAPRAESMRGPETDRRSVGRSGPRHVAAASRDNTASRGNISSRAIAAPRANAASRQQQTHAPERFATPPTAIATDERPVTQAPTASHRRTVPQAAPPAMRTQMGKKPSTPTAQATSKPQLSTPAPNTEQVWAMFGLESAARTAQRPLEQRMPLRREVAKPASDAVPAASTQSERASKTRVLLRVLPSDSMKSAANATTTIEHEQVVYRVKFPTSSADAAGSGK